MYSSSVVIDLSSGIRAIVATTMRKYKNQQVGSVLMVYPKYSLATQTESAPPIVRARPRWAKRAVIECLMGGLYRKFITEYENRQCQLQ